MTGESMGELFVEWKAYHEANPEVYRLICRFADEVISRGYREYGIATIWERIRWHVSIELGEEEFKLPNNHRAYYARLWLDDHPDYPDFFHTACLRSVVGGPRDRWGRSFDDMHPDDPEPKLF
jgi:hypothetical protein